LFGRLVVRYGALLCNLHWYILVSM